MSIFGKKKKVKPKPENLDPNMPYENEVWITNYGAERTIVEVRIERNDIFVFYRVRYDEILWKSLDSFLSDCKRAPRSYK